LHRRQVKTSSLGALGKQLCGLLMQATYQVPCHVVHDHADDSLKKSI
jgi:hypothetical protein